MNTRRAAIFLGSLLLIFAVLLVFLFSGFGAPIILGSLLAVLSRPLYERILKGLGGDRKRLAALFVLLLVVFAIVLPFFGALTLLAKEGQLIFLETKGQFVASSPLFQKVELFLNRFNIDASGLIESQLAPQLQRLGLFVYEKITGLLLNAVNLLLGFVLMLVTIYYLLKDGRVLGAFLMQAIPMGEADKIKIYQAFRRTGRAVFLGMFLSALAQGTLGGLGFLIFGLPHPVFWGAIMTFLSLIPLLGPYLIFIPAALYLFLAGETFLAVLFLLYNILLVSTVDNIIRPAMISGRLNIHPLLIIFSVLGGLKVFGFLGIIYGPLIASVFLVLLETYLAAGRTPQNEPTH